MGFNKNAVREKIAIKGLVFGPSGAGKTTAGLKLATGIAQALNKAEGVDKPMTDRIAALDMESGRLLYYLANPGEEVDLERKFKFAYDTLKGKEGGKLEEHSPANYIRKIGDAEEAGFDILLIDGLSQEWKYLNDLNASMPSKGPFGNWDVLKGMHWELMQKILNSPLHIIATGRGKDEYLIEANEKGKQQPKKVGVGLTQEKDIEYEFTFTLNLMQKTFVADVMKDNTGIFQGRYEPVSVKNGEELYNWANSGEESPTKYQSEVVALAKSLGGSKDEAVRNIVEGSIECVNPKDCTDINKLKTAIAGLEKLKKERGVK